VILAGGEREAVLAADEHDEARLLAIEKILHDDPATRVAQRAIELARESGLRAGKLRLITCWPFPEKRIRELASTAKAFVVPELNLGQMVREVERAARGRSRTIAVPHAGGSVHRPEDILKAVAEASR